MNIGASVTRARLSVSDNSNESYPEMIRLEAFDVKLQLLTNTGIRIPFISMAQVLIRPENLSATTNIPPQPLLDDIRSSHGNSINREGKIEKKSLVEELEVRYEVINDPKFGELQMQKDLRDDNWGSTRIFSQKMIDSLQVSAYSPISLLR